MIRAFFSNFRKQLNRYILYKFLKKILRHHRLLVNDPNLDISQIHIKNTFANYSFKNAI